jgi:hypothetical protein
LRRVLNEGRGEVDASHPSSTRREQPRVVPFAAADVETRTAADLRQQRQERGCVQRVAIDVPALARQGGPGVGFDSQ